MGNKKIIIVVMAIVLTAIASVLGFDYSAYKPSSLKEIGDKAKERVGCNVKVTKDEKPGFDFYLEKLRVGIRLTDYPLELSKGEFNIEKINILEYYFNTFSINREHIKIFTHQLEIKESGYSFTLLFQGPLVSPLRKEAKPGDYVLLYVVFGIYDHFKKRTILLVNEFQVEKDEVKKKG